jgi:fatty acid desaturase
VGGVSGSLGLALDPGAMSLPGAVKSILGFLNPPSLAMGLAHFALAQTLCGLLLAVAFGVGHNGMAVFEPATRPAYGELQVATTRNVDNDALGLTGWFMGGLHVQIEHHLYPAVPRHNLEAIRPRVQALCKKHGVPYHSTSLLQGTVEVLAHLDHVVKDFPAN